MKTTIYNSITGDERTLPDLGTACARMYNLMQHGKVGQGWSTNWPRINQDNPEMLITMAKCYGYSLVDNKLTK